MESIYESTPGRGSQGGSHGDHKQTEKDSVFRCAIETGNIKLGIEVRWCGAVEVKCRGKRHFGILYHTACLANSPKVPVVAMLDYLLDETGLLYVMLSDTITNMNVLQGTAVECCRIDLLMYLAGRVNNGEVIVYL